MRERQEKLEFTLASGTETVLAEIERGTVQSTKRAIAVNFTLLRPRALDGREGSFCGWFEVFVKDSLVMYKKQTK